MIDQGADPELIQAQLGHSSISITYDTYRHLPPTASTTLHHDSTS